MSGGLDSLLFKERDFTTLIASDAHLGPTNANNSES